MSFHKFDPFTGRLKQTTQTQALYPIPPSKVPKETPIMIYDSIKTKPVQVSTRHQSTLNPKMAALYKKYQVDLEKPTYLLGGAKDILIYRASIVVVSVMCGINMYYLYKLNKKFS